MNILNEILGAGHGQVLDRLGGQAGLDRQQAESALGSLLPALTGGIKRNMSNEEGLGSLLAALSRGNHQRYIDEPECLGDQSSIDDGNGILGHILGGKEQSRQVAAQAAQSTGLDISILKNMLPMIAGLAMGAMNKQASSSGMLEQMQGGGGIGDVLSQLSGSGGSQLGGLASFLDLDGDGSVADDVLGLAKKLF
jgi:hypothetical protein